MSRFRAEDLVVESKPDLTLVSDADRAAEEMVRHQLKRTRPRDAVEGEEFETTGRGRHTSSSAVSLRLPGGKGWVVDTPGVRSFGLAHVDLSRIIQHFPDLEPGTDQCPRVHT